MLLGSSIMEDKSFAVFRPLFIVSRRILILPERSRLNYFLRQIFSIGKTNTKMDKCQLPYTKLRAHPRHLKLPLHMRLNESISSGYCHSSVDSFSNTIQPPRI